LEIIIEPKLELFITCKMEETRILLKAVKVISAKVKARSLKVMCTWSGTMGKKGHPLDLSIFGVGLTVTDQKNRDPLKAMTHLRRAIPEFRKAFGDFLISHRKASRK
jgi:hypothetical protein